MKRTALVIALLASACSQAPQSTNNTAVAGEVSGYSLRSNVEGASLVKVGELATVQPAKVEIEGYCAERFIEPKTAGGKLAAGKGWRVTQEAKFNQFNAVLIVRGLDPMTSGRCQAIDANIAFFESDRLVGILYPKGKDGISIGTMLTENGHFRIFSPDPMLQGQLNLSGTNLTFDRVTASDSVCDGKFTVPNLHGLDYPQARRKLLAAGWLAKPSTMEADENDSVISFRQKFPETDGCAGTGYGECSFTLTAADGRAGLSVTTLGGFDDAVVSSYEAICHGKFADDGP